MKKSITEESILLVSIFKWFIVASLIGVVVGFSTSLFLFALKWSTIRLGEHSYYFLLLPLALALSSYITKYLAPEAEGHGTEKVIEAVHRHDGYIKPIVVPIKLVTTVITLACGGSAGKEGPCAQIGGGLASIIGNLLHFDKADRKKLVICGISAGFASVFGTPIAGAIFGIEVLFIGGIMYEVLLPTFIAGVMGYQVSAALGISYFYHQIDFVPSFTELFFIKVLFSGILFGICSLLLVETLNLFQRLSEKIPWWAPLKGLLGGTALILLTLIFSTDYLGLGLDTIEATLAGARVVWYAFAVKIIFTCITLTFGGSGGMVTPVFFIGATFGSLLGAMLGVDPATFAAIGMVALLAGAANTPIAASILAVELFGSQIAPYAAVACVTSFLMTGHRSVYPSQIFAIMKSSSFRDQTGKEVTDAQAEFLLRRKSLTRYILSLIRKVFRN
ncbi:MAG: chloride channel protein [Desulfobulbales bacterium]|jgi:H+/Cl- antiporter ClcA|nr:chloride channel protein [Desulfobulbaceae bacterium]